jgi:hypothetical protein
VAATKAAFEADKVPLDLFLEAQRREADADSGFFGALVEYALAIKNLHYTKGSLLDYNEIYLSEGPWPDKAYADAAKLKTKKHELLDYRMKPAPVSLGPLPQPAGSEMPMGYPQGPAEGVPPGAEVWPLPPVNAPQPNGPTSPPPAQTPSSPPPSIPPAPQSTIRIAPQAETARSASPQPLAPGQGPDLSSPTSHQQPDLQPHNERLLSPAVQPAMSRPMAMDELIASQSPPAASAPIAPRTATPATAATTAESPESAAPAADTSELNRRSNAFAESHAPEASTLSIYSRSSNPPPIVEETAPQPTTDLSLVRVVTEAPPAGVQPAKPIAAPPITASESSNPPVRPAAANQSNSTARASWPESTFQSRPPVDRNDGIMPGPAPSVDGSIWTRGSVQPASYPADVSTSTTQESAPSRYTPPQSPMARFSIPQSTISPNVPPAAGPPQSEPANNASHAPSSTEMFQPLPPMHENQSSDGTPQASTLNLVQPLPAPKQPSPQGNTLQPLPPFGR